MTTGLASAAAWYTSWTWGLPLIVLNVVNHVIGLGLIIERVIEAVGGAGMDRRRFLPRFVAATSVTVVAATALHGLEGVIWAFAYLSVGALPDYRTAMLYSISAITGYGHAGIFLADHWKMVGALEALNGMILFGLTAAFLFAMIRQLWPGGSRDSG